MWVRETNTRPLTTASCIFFAGQVANWPGWVEICIEHIKDIYFRASAPEIYFPARYVWSQKNPGWNFVYILAEIFRAKKLIYGICKKQQKSSMHEKFHHLYRKVYIELNFK